ncbi:MAG TPA: zinc ribbon domain-containing protein [Blastocatellia bacterium]|nr:zinc ribbon domain-containing protein [Blastocatellia bacterium]
MYCSSCGARVNPGLKYCKNCGAEQGAKDRSASQMSATMPESIIWAIVSISLGGLALLIGLMAVMKNVLNFDDGVIIGFTALSFLLLVVALCVVIWMAARTRAGSKQPLEKIEPKRETATDLDAARERLLPEPVYTVTEHTTRDLETANRERRSE